MSFGIRVKAGQELPLVFLLPSGPPSLPLFVRLTLDRPDGTVIAGPFQMTYISSAAKYVYEGYFMPSNEQFVHARYDVFTQSDWEEASRSQVQSDEDVFHLDTGSGGSAGASCSLKGVVSSGSLKGKFKC